MVIIVLQGIVSYSDIDAVGWVLAGGYVVLAVLYVWIRAPYAASVQASGGKPQS